MFNGMVSPLVPYAIRGVVWYQGESDVQDGMIYAEKMKALVAGWRAVWGEGEFPFLYVQIAPYTFPGNPKMSLPELWEAQAAAERSIPNCGMAVINDVGDVKNHHPANKRAVGERLALLAMNGAYGRKEIVCRGPRVKSVSREGEALRIRFSDTGAGLVTRDGQAPRPFEMAGADDKFLPATATIEGEAVLVLSNAVKAPSAVRFAWGIDPLPNLMNKDGLPASAFKVTVTEP